MKVKTVMFIQLAVSGLAASAFSMGDLDHGTGWYPAGTNLTITATPDPYYMVDRWEGADETNGVNEVAIVVSGSRTVSAFFKAVVTDAGSVPHYWLADVYPAWTNDFEAAATNDWDGDGFTTEQEYWAGTDPTNNNSYLRISSIERSVDGIRLVSSHARVDSGIPPLLIEGRNSLADGSWVSITNNIPVDGENSWNVLAGEHRFYRLRVNRP